MPPSIGWIGTSEPWRTGGRDDWTTATQVEKFAPNGGQVIAVRRRRSSCSACIVAWAFDPDGVPLWVPALALARRDR